MTLKFYCDVCGKFISEKGYGTPEDVHRPFVIAHYFVLKGLDEPITGWGESCDEVEFWACKECKDEFMGKVNKIFTDMKAKYKVK